MRRHFGLLLPLHRLQRIKESHGRVALGRGGQVERGLGQVEAALRHPHVLKRLRRRYHHTQCVRVSEAHVLTGKDDHAAEDEARLLARVDHPRHPVERRVRVRAAQALDERADGVVVDIAFFVVEHGATLDGLLGDGAGDMDAGCVERGVCNVGRIASHRDAARYFVFRFGRGSCGLRGFDGQLQGVKHAAGIAVGHVDQMGQGVVVDLDVQLSITTLGIGDGLPRDVEEIFFGQRLKLEDAAAADQRLVDLEVGVFSRRADQDHRAVLDPGQQGILLRLVEAVHFVHEENGALAELAATLLRGGDGGADVGNTGQHGVNGDEIRPRSIGNNTRQSRLARARRPVEDH